MKKKLPIITRGILVTALLLLAAALLNTTSVQSAYPNAINAGTLSVVIDLITDNGGSLINTDFEFSIDNGSTWIPFELDGQNDLPVDNDTYTIIGNDVTGYSISYLDCTDVVIADNTATCTITFDDIAPQLTIVKDPTNDNGGNAAPDDFLLTVGGVAATSGVAKVLDANTPYAINETQLTGYTFVEITDDGSGKCPAALGGTVTLDEGDDITCTIVNDDVAPQLTLIKDPTNDSGGTAAPDDFLLTIGGEAATSGVAKVLAANTLYAINETQLTGYTFVEITDDGSGKCPAALGGTITLDEGDDITCTIVNDDVAPQLTLVKDPTNDSGGTAAPDDFQLTVGGSPVLSGVATEYPVDTPLAINETQLPGYEFVSIIDDGSTKCPAVLGGTVTLALGDDITCTIVNDDVAAIIADPAADLVTIEDGTTDQFTVVLTTIPTAGVTINVSSSLPSEATVSPAVLPFTVGNWNVPQVVTVTGVDDLVADGDKPYLITLDPGTSAAAEYAALPAVQITGINYDNDTPGYIITPTTNLTTTEGEGAQKVTISLRSKPKSQVSLSLVSSDLTEGKVSPTSMIFDPADWPPPPKEFTITGVDDCLNDGNVQYTITITAASSDPDYSGPVDVLTVTNYDAPTIGWVKPVNETVRYYYTTSLNPILLEVKRLCTEPISKVRFYRWVPSVGDWVTIGEDLNPPYQETIDPTELEFGYNEIRAFAFGAVPTQPGEIQTFSTHPYIFISRDFGDTYVYLPLISKKP